MRTSCLIAAITLIAGGCRDASPPPRQEIPGVDMLRFGAFEYKERMKLPDDILKWNGKRVRATGFMNPLREVRGIKEFELVKDRGSCCFGRRPLWNHFFQVTLRANETTDYTSDPISVEGRLSIEERWDGDWLMGLYWLDDATVVKTP